MDEIEHREQENPDEVHDVPAESAEIDGREVVAAELSTNRLNQQPEDDTERISSA